MTLDARNQLKNNTITSLFSIIVTLLILFVTRSLQKGDDLKKLLDDKPNYEYVDKRDEAITRQCNENLKDLQKVQNEKLDLIIKLIDTKK